MTRSKVKKETQCFDLGAWMTLYRTMLMYIINNNIGLYISEDSETYDVTLSEISDSISCKIFIKGPNREEFDGYPKELQFKTLYFQIRDAFGKQPKWILGYEPIEEETIKSIKGGDKS